MDSPKHPIVDCHTHLCSIAEMAGFQEIMRDTGIVAISLLTLGNPTPPWWARPGTPEWDSRGHPRDFSVNVAAMYCKALHPDQVYVFGGLDHYSREVLAGNRDYARQAQTLIEMGIDGFKMWEGSYVLRNKLGIPLDSPVYDELFSLLEAAQLPLLYHVEFRDEFERILPKHPRLKLILAHFYGGAREPERLDQFLDTWPNANVDITPGRIFKNISDRRDVQRKLFVKHQDRILFGTDSTAVSPERVAGGKRTARFLRRLLERKDDLALHEIGITNPAETPPEPGLSPVQLPSRMERWADHGLYLDDDVLAKIYSGNFRRLVGATSRPVNARVALAETEKLIDRVQGRTDRVEDLRELEQIAGTFRSML